MGNDNDSGQNRADNPKDTSQGSRNRRWRRRRTPQGPAAGNQEARPAENQNRPQPDSPKSTPPAAQQPSQPKDGQQRRSSRRGGRARQDNRPRQPGDAGQQPAQQAGQENQQQRRPGRRDRGSQPPREGQDAQKQRPAQDNRQRQRTRPAQSTPGQPDATRGQRNPRQGNAGVTSPRKRPKRGDRAQSVYRPAQNFPSSTPIKARGGIKALNSEGGEFGKNWWAKRWLLAMERLMDGARLQRGRRYARMGQVLSMNEVSGDVVAKVQGSRPQPYKVVISVTPFSDEQWDQVLDVLAGRAIFTAQLLAGEMPPTIEEAFSAAGVSLFPARGGDLHTECSCPDWANPCKHIAATQYILADRFDEDPFLLFRMRGRTQENILQALRLRRTGSEAPAETPEPEEETAAPALEAGISRFWEMGPGLEDFSVNVQQPQIPLPLFKRLGEPDVAGQHSLEENLGPALDMISQTAIFLAFTDTSREPTENGDGG